MELAKNMTRGTTCSGKNQSQQQSLSGGFGHLAKIVATGSGHPVTFLVALSIILVWAVTGPIFKFNDTWQLVINTGTTIVTFLMVFLIQNTQNRDSAALQLKIDELIRAMESAHNEVIGLEDKTPEELEDLKSQYETLAEKADDVQARKKRKKRAS